MTLSGAVAPTLVSPSRHRRWLFRRRLRTNWVAQVPRDPRGATMWSSLVAP